MAELGDHILLQRNCSKQTPASLGLSSNRGEFQACFQAYSILHTVASSPSYPQAQIGLQDWWCKTLGSLFSVMAVFPLGVFPSLCMILFPQYLGIRLQMRSSSMQFHDAGTAKKHISMATTGLPHTTAYRC